MLRQEFGGTKVQLKPLTTQLVDGLQIVTEVTITLTIIISSSLSLACDCKQALLVCKWGGELTHAGIGQAEQYGPVFWDEMLRPPYSGGNNTTITHGFSQV